MTTLRFGRAVAEGRRAGLSVAAAPPGMIVLDRELRIVAVQAAGAARPGRPEARGRAARRRRPRRPQRHRGRGRAGARHRQRRGRGRGRRGDGRHVVSLFPAAGAGSGDGHLRLRGRARGRRRGRGRAGGDRGRGRGCDRLDRSRGRHPQLESGRRAAVRVRGRRGDRPADHARRARRGAQQCRARSAGVAAGRARPAARDGQVAQGRVADRGVGDGRAGARPPTATPRGDRRDRPRRHRPAPRASAATERALRESERRRRQVLASMLHAEEVERSRIATELHDDTVQVMIASLMAMDRVALVAQKTGSAQLESAVSVARATLEEATDRTRRLMFELRPAVLLRDGLRGRHARARPAGRPRDGGERAGARGGRPGTTIRSRSSCTGRCRRRSRTSASTRGPTRSRSRSTSRRGMIRAEICDDGLGFDIVDAGLAAAVGPAPRPGRAARARRGGRRDCSRSTRRPARARVCA